MHVPKDLSMNPSSDQTFPDQRTDWLATNAPRRLASTTIVEYQRQVVAFARWMDALIVHSIHCIVTWHASVLLSMRPRYAGHDLFRTGAPWAPSYIGRKVRGGW